jgi:hypothetical protein
MSKQVRANVEHMICEVCGRTMLKGERTEPYLTPSRERKLVCQLCAPRAQQEGWIRESANPGTPARPPRPQEGGRRFRRARKAALALGESLLPDSPGGAPDRSDSPPSLGPGEGADGAADRSRKTRFQRDPRHVRAVPTNAQLKLERAVELFNESEHPRTVAGIARTLGSPRVSASASSASAAEVIVTVAWDISWYQFVIDLSDTNDPVRMDARGEELDELRPDARDWNATASEDGRLTIGVGEDSDGDRQERVL